MTDFTVTAINFIVIVNVAFIIIVGIMIGLGFKSSGIAVASTAAKIQARICNVAMG
jgi:hypothetical protein